ncbi:hypothetical protein Q5530_19050 [Saccharothrix sp. BKS2]|uniref:hypothetical protein n=1 Tax=Saccharothrix sp. BKS2 TaxID=3064400 RepID=UPI0039EC7F1D
MTRNVHTRQVPDPGELVDRPRGWARLTWPLAIRPPHDALIEDLPDNAARAADHPHAHPNRWSPRVRLPRAAAKRRV